MNHIGRAIAVIREARHMTQKSLGYAAGLDASYISIIESGRRNPRSHMLNKIAEALRVQTHTLMLLAVTGEEYAAMRPEMRDVLARDVLDIIMEGDDE